MRERGVWLWAAAACLPYWACAADARFDALIHGAPRRTDVPLPDPSHVALVFGKDLQWKGPPGEQQALLFGDPDKPGIYGVLIRWDPGHYSRPHIHSTDRYAYVVSGTWWVSAADHWDPAQTYPVPAGTYVRDVANTVHWDGARDEPCLLMLVGEGPMKNHDFAGGEMMRMLGVLTSVLLAAAAPDLAQAAEELGQVEFATSCATAERAPFNRGVALLHDFWYDEAERQFGEILARDPACAMAHWGIAMSVFHQIWNRPDKSALAKGLKEMQAARAAHPRTPRERAYVEALYAFFAPGQTDFATRVNGYVRQMADLHGNHAADVDATAFYALAILAAEPPGDTSLQPERQAEALLQPAFAAHPQHPGVIHYLIHACDTPSLADKGLAAARAYGKVAPSGAHAAHMPGHIFARLGMWQEDIESNLVSVSDSKQAQHLHPMENFDEFHSNEFLLYAYLQSGQEARARELVDVNARLVEHALAMPEMSGGPMAGMYGVYRSEFPAFYYLELRDWKTAAALPVDTDSHPEAQMLTVWARAVAAGHLRDGEAARAELARFESLTEKVRHGERPWYADSTGVQVAEAELRGWTAHAAGDEAGAETHLRQAADLQDTVGQGEVDIPAREMLADLLLDLQRYPQALSEYQGALKLSPNRFNGLFNAGLAAEGAGDRGQAGEFYAQLLRVTAEGKDSSRPEFGHVREFVRPTTAQR